MLDNIVLEGRLKYNGEIYPIYAHADNGKVEYYNDHAMKTWTIFEYFLNSQENLINNLFEQMRKEHSLTINYGDFKDFLQDIVVFHDIGKVNPKFQKDKLTNQAFETLNIPLGVHSQHSYPSAFILLTVLSKKYNIEENPTLLTFVYAVLGHHTRLRSPHESSIGGTKFEDFIPTLVYLFELLGLGNEKLEGIINTFGEDYGGVYKEFRDQLEEVDTSTISILYNLVYSYLIKADFIATSYAYDNLSRIKKNLYNFNERIDRTLLEKMTERFIETQEGYKQKLNENELNKYRQEMFEEARKNLILSLEDDKRVFYLKMPTGGGKTNASLGLALEILERKPVDRLIYTLPYINILEQNYEYLKQVFDLEEPVEIRKIYSGTETIFDEDVEGKEKILTDDDFYNYPVICTTNVSLFNSIVKFNKKHKYRFSSLTSSVIVLDEIQSLPPEYWPEFNFLINELAEKLNIYFIIMSATVPSLEKLKQARERDSKYEKEVSYLIKYPNKYFSKFKRNTIKTTELPKFDICDNSGKENLKNYLKGICEENFSCAKNHGLIVLNTVQTSQTVYGIISDLSKENDWRTDAMLLNSTFLPVQKKSIIKRINNFQDSERVILVSTQSIEAGMDVSFDFVIRDFAILDSIEQVRGRCNRHKEGDDGNVYLIEIMRNNKFEHSMIYEKWRMDTTKKVLEDLYFDYTYHHINDYYTRIIEHINTELKNKLEVNSIDNIKCWNRLQFEENNAPRNRFNDVFHVDIIQENNNSFSFFVEIEAPLEQFTIKEIKYIEKLQKESGIQIISKDRILGKELIKYYRTELKKLKSRDFTEKKIFKREMMSILSKFVFSATIHKSKEELDFIFSGDKVGPFYIIKDENVGDGPEKWYSIKKGFKKEFLDKLHQNCFML